jgi:hypothetical protein
MLFVRDVLQIGSRQCRVIGIAGPHAFLFDLLAAKTSIEAVSMDELLCSLAKCKLSLVTAHSFNRPRHVGASQAQQAKAEVLLAVVLAILRAGPSAFDSAARGHLVSKAAKECRLTATTIHQALYRFWKYGLTVDALLPAFDRRGRALNERRRSDRPLGRPGPANAKPAPALTEDILAAFAKGTDRYYRNNPKNTFAEAYRLICDDLLTQCVFDPSTGAPVTFIKRSADDVALPTLRQYRYWYHKQDRAKTDKRGRMHEPKYEARHRPKLSYAAQDNENIGGRYIIDSTPLDLNLVSRLNATTFLSTPTLYLVTDEYTGLIVGFSLSFEDASWSAASLALLNAVEDKVSYCARFGIIIAEEDWSGADLVAMRLLYDKGEAKGSLAEAFGRKSSLTIENAASYRGDLKGIGEQRFDLVNEALRGRLPGYRVKKSGERGEQDPRLDALLDLDEATAVIIHTILFLNKHEIATFRRSRAMIEDGIPPIPLEMWTWAKRTGRTALQRRSYDEMLVALLPTAQATITQEGLAFETLHYTCARADKEKWFECVTMPAWLRRRDISYHPWLTDVVYVHGPEPGDVEVAVLTPHSARFAGLSFHELKQLREEERGNGRNRQSDQILNHASFSNNVRQIVEQAQAKRLHRLRPRDLVGARAGRSAEREFDREDHRDAMRQAALNQAVPGTAQLRLPPPNFLSGDDLGDGPLPEGL